MKRLRLTRKSLPLYVLAAAVVGAPMAVSTVAMAASSSAAPAATASSLPACPFWAGDITPPPRPATTFTAPLQTAAPVNYTSLMPAPTMTGSLDANGDVDLTVARVPGAVVYRIWRDGVAVAWITDWGQTTLTATDTSPCANAYYQVVALSSNSTATSAMGQISQPYWLGSDGTIAQGAQNPAPGTSIAMRVTSYNDGGQTADGYATQIGVCATDPRVIPWGTYFSVPYYGTCVAEDIGTWISGDAVDLWLPGTQADNWGVQYMNVTILANPFGSTSTGSPPPSSPPPTTPPPSSPPPTTPAGTCATAYSSTAIYTAGMQASENGIDYTANFWTQGNDPATNNGGSGSGEPWTSNGACT